MILKNKTKSLLITINLLSNAPKSFHLAAIYLFKVNNENTRKMCEICSKLTLKTPEPCKELFAKIAAFVYNYFHKKLQTFWCLSCQLWTDQSYTSRYLLAQSQQRKHKKNERRPAALLKRLKHDIVLVFLLLTLNIFHTFFGVSIVDFEHLNISLG